MLNAAERTAVEAESQQLRLALKTWETAWAREHGGAKPAREDISRNPDIARKYKAYNYTRALLSGKASTSSGAKKDESRRKRKQALAPSTAAAPADTQPMQTPSKRMRATVTRATPSRAVPSATPTQAGGGGYLDAHLDMTPSISRKLFSPVVPTSIGPTPQRDGRVLGLFDVLNEEEEKRAKRSAVAATPSKRATAEADAARGQSGQRAEASAAVLGATPRKQTLNVEAYKSDDDDDDNEDGDNVINARRLGRTPMSSGRRNLLNHFTAGGRGAGPFAIIDRSTSSTAARESNSALGTTPLKPRADDNQTAAHQRNLLTTPSKGNGDGLQHAFATPAFLRRQSSALAPVDENGEFMSPPGKLRLPRKPLMRGLSSVLASLRQAEDDALDEQLDVLRDLESSADMNAPPRPPPPSRRPSAKAANGQPSNTVEVEDSQVQGPQENPQEQQDWEQHELEQRELELYEQKQAKLEQQKQLLGPDHAAGGLLGGFDDEGRYDSPPEDQLGRDGQPLRVFKKKGQKRTTRLSNIRPTRTKRPAAGAMAENDSDNENGGEANENEDPNASDSEFGSGAEGDVPVGRKAGKAKKTTDKTANGPVKKAVRKVNELAHANFKRLKLRNNGAKGGPGFNSRFRRRR
ncbi:hypothetical protein SCUCBS95973_000187 [Sporothrix curviconia]|uniref:DNA replication regulator SLD2 n=1 Tax=Sporothrix curviconia TaxID=1260050 RepID=A0ABP0AN57_9PEZI